MLLLSALAVIILVGQSNIEGDGTEPQATIAARLPDTLIVQCAHGGSQISDWQPGASRYEACVARVLDSGLPIRAVFFSQGEAEASAAALYPPDRTPIPADEWEARFADSVSGFRRDLNAPTLPILLVELGSTTMTPEQVPYWQDIRTQQEHAATTLQQVILVNVDDAPLDPDGLHHTSEGYRLIADRLVDALLSVGP